MARLNKSGARRGTTLVETVCSLGIMVMFGVPLLGGLQTTTRCVGVTRDYLVAEMLTDLLFEHTAFYSASDDAGAFLEVIEQLEVSESQVSPYTGLQGKAVAHLGLTVLPDEETGEEGELEEAPAEVDEDVEVQPLAVTEGEQPCFSVFDMEGRFGSLLKKYSYTLSINEAQGDSVMAGASGATLYRVDIALHWKGSDRRYRTYEYSNYLARRNY